MILKTVFFVKKLKISCSLYYTILFKFHLHVVQTFSKECMERLPMSALATVVRKSFNDNLAFYVTIAETDIGSLKSHHTLFDKYLDHMLVKFEQNRMVRTTNFELFDQNK